MHHYPFHPGDYLLATCHLDPLHDLAYRRLIDYYYSEEKPIPTETDWVSRRIRLDKQIIDDVLAEFFQLTETGWQHRRCDREIAAYYKKAETAKSNGMKGGRPKKTKNNPEETNPVSGGLAKKTGYGSSSGSGSMSGKEVQEENHADFPTGFPSTAAQAIEMARTVGCTAPDEYLSEVWKQASGRGGRDGAGAMIRRWGTHVDGRWDREQSDWKAKRNGNHHGSNTRTPTPHRRDNAVLNLPGRYE